jgi:NADH:ubiquinone oxidoreductase subunit 4 (subunit M)
MGLLVIAIVFTGLFPQPVLEKVEPSIIKTINASKQQYDVVSEELKEIAPILKYSSR